MLVNIPNIPAPQREPDPQPSAITRALCAELIRREQVGTLKYGKPLEPHDGRRTLVDVREELLDACVYITKCIMEQEWQPISTAPKDERILMASGLGVGTGGWRVAKPWDVTGYDFYFDGCNLPSDATHWKPLPLPPQDADK